jgi:hypothetical protein
VEPSEIEHARSAQVAIAYQVLGDGPVDLVFTRFVGKLATTFPRRPTS